MAEQNSNAKQVPFSQALFGLVLTTFCAVLMAGTVAIVTTPAAVAQPGALPNLTPEGWSRNTELNGLKIDQYDIDSKTLSIDLIAFPPTTESASRWTESFIRKMLKPDIEAGYDLHLLNEDEMGKDTASGPMNTSGPGVDIATYTVLVLRPKAAGRNLILNVRGIVREGEPVQVSLLTIPGEGTKSTDAEYAQASKIRFEARLPINESAAFLGLDGMIPVLTGPLIYPETPTRTSEPVAQKSRIPSSKSKTSEPAENVKAVSGNGYAPPLVSIPGPRVKITGNMLSNLPAGYRMHVTVTNYWTNRSLTATRMNHLTLTKDGQFEKSHFSIAGGAPGQTGPQTGVVTSSDKTGSTGSVLGSTGAGESGAKSVYLNKREGLDPSMYGTYYISGNKIEFLYANGKSESLALTTDGYNTMVIGEKKYFAKAPKGWERVSRRIGHRYRSLDGAYIVKASRVAGSTTDGVKYMQRYITAAKEEGLIVSAGPIKKLKAGRHDIAKSTMLLRTPATGKTHTEEIYVRYGANPTISRLARVIRYKGAGSEDRILDFIGKMP